MLLNCVEKTPPLSRAKGSGRMKKSTHTAASSTMSTAGEREKKAKRPRRENPVERAEEEVPGSASQSSSASTPRQVGLRVIDAALHRSTASLGVPNLEVPIPLQAPMSISDLALLNASIARSILMREQEISNRLQLSMLSRATTDSLALQMLRTQHPQQAYGTMLQPQFLQRQALLNQLQGVQGPRGPPSALLPNSSPQQPPLLSHPSVLPAILPIASGVHSLGVVQQPQDLLTSALALVAREEARRQPIPDGGGGGQPGPGRGSSLNPNGCLYHPRAFPVSVESDKDCTSKYQAFLREQLLYFETVPLDTQASAKGRNKPIKVGQVGIMCKHCRNVPPPKRPRGSVYYPQKLVGVYQSAQNMSKNHFAGTGCANAPAHVNDELKRLRAEQTSFYGGGQPYWAKSAALAGIIETDDGLEFGPSVLSSAPSVGGKGAPNIRS